MEINAKKTLFIVNILCHKLNLSTARKKSFREETQEEKKSSKMSKRQGSPLSAGRDKDGRVFSPEQHHLGASQSAESKTFSDSASQRSVEPSNEASFYRETEGAMRDRFVVDINLIDGQPFKGTVTRTEALKHIFIRALGFSAAEFHGAIPAFKGHPVVIFKTKEIFNIDERLAGKSFFTYQKKVKTDQGEKVVEMTCTIKGIRGMDSTERQVSAYTWLKIEGAEYLLDEEQMKVWLSEYGFLVSGVTEDMEDVEGQSSEDEEIRNDVDISTGIYSARIKLNKVIPQLIPMHGKKIRIYHKGIKKQCVNCYETGHFKRDCKNERKEWLDYVDYFMLSTPLPEGLYGNWVRMVEEWRMKNPEKHSRNRAGVEEEVKREEKSRREREESVAAITKILQEQKLASDNDRGKASGSTRPEVGEEREEESSSSREQNTVTEMDQDVQTFAKPGNKKSVKQLLKKSNARGKGRGRGGSQSLQNSPTVTPPNERQNE